jgi:hypothetical protein
LARTEYSYLGEAQGERERERERERETMLHQQELMETGDQQELMETGAVDLLALLVQKCKY